MGAQLFKGSLQVLGDAADSPAITGVSGLGHITLAVALVLFSIALRTRLKAVESVQPRDELTTTG